MAVRECHAPRKRGFHNGQWKAYEARSTLSPVIAETLVQKAKATSAPSTIYKITVPNHIEQMIRDAGPNGIDLAVLAEEAFQDRKPVKNPRGSAQTAISLLRRRGLPIYNSGSIYRMGAPVVLHTTARTRALQRPNTVSQPLSERELEIVSIFRRFAIDAEDDIWLSAADLADEMKVSRNGKKTHRQHVSAMIRNIVAKGFTIECRNAGFGNALMAYHFVGRRSN